MPETAGLLALGAPVLQIVAMGVIGYPIAQRRPGGMERFHRSGFTWWLITLTALLFVGLAADPGLLAAPTPQLAWIPAATVAVIALELAGDAFAARRASARRGRERYESALPHWARDPKAERGLLVVTAVLEEAVFRGLALAALAVTLGDTAALLITAAAFGAAHWYYGPAQVGLKTLAGLALGVTALTAGWPAAAAAHAIANLVLVEIARRAR